MDPFVSREWSAPATTDKDFGWDRRPRSISSTHRRRHGPAHEGPSSLTEMAARVAAANIHSFDGSYLDKLAPRVLRAILKQLMRYPESMSLSAWKCTRKIILELRDTQSSMALAVHRFHQQFEVPTAPLSVYLKPLQSGNFTFISHLKIAGSCLIKSAELTQLPSLVKNLGVLEIIEPSDSSLPFPWLSDRLVKAWTIQEDPFPKLKVLKVHTKESLTEECLQYVTQLPALAMLEVLGAKKDWRNADPLAREHGWIPSRWTTASFCHTDRGRPFSSKGAGVTNQLSWLGLAKRIGGKSRSTFVDAGVMGYETYTQLEQPVLIALSGDFALDDSHHPSSPFASLTLGRDSQTIGATYSTPPFMETMFFWRYWECASPHAPGGQFAPAENAIRKPIPTKSNPQATTQEEGGKKKKKRRERPESGVSMRPRKKLRLGEALSQFQGK